MFAVIYKFRVKAGFEEQFKSAWATRTQEIKTSFGSLGSRLHNASDGSWIAYAQWPNRLCWETAGSSGGESTPAQLSMRESTESIQTLFELELAKDLLEPIRVD